MKCLNFIHSHDISSLYQLSTSLMNQNKFGLKKKDTPINLFVYEYKNSKKMEIFLLLKKQEAEFLIQITILNQLIKLRKNYNLIIDNQ